MENGAYSSPTLASLKSVPDTVCARCPNSLWFVVGTNPRCFCKAMHMTTWSDEEQLEITGCDGEFLE